MDAIFLTEGAVARCGTSYTGRVTSEAEHPSLRERKKQRTRAAIHRAALQLVHARGIDGVTVGEIAEAAGVSARTFFNYWESKEAAVIGMDPVAVEAMLAALRERPAQESMVEALQVITADRLLVMTEPPDLRGLRREVMQAEPRLQLRTHAIFGALQQGLVDALTARAVACGQEERPAREQAVVATALSSALVRAAMIFAMEGDLPIEEAYARSRQIAADLPAIGPVA